MGHWYVIETNPNCERKAAGELRRAGVRAYLPKRSFERRNRRTGVVSIKTMPLLTGYLFIRFPQDIEDWFTVRRCQGVRGVLAIDGTYGQIPDSIIAGFMRRQRSGEFGKPAFEARPKRFARLKNKYYEGRPMLVTDGPFASFLATIEKLHKNGDVEAAVSIFGRATLIKFDKPEEMLKPLASSYKAA